MLLPVVAVPDPAANFLHVGAQIFCIVPLRNLGKNALQLLIRLLFGGGDFFATVLSSYLHPAFYFHGSF